MKSISASISFRERQRTTGILLALLVLLAEGSLTVAAKEETRAARKALAVIESIRHADYRGDRTALAALAADLARPEFKGAMPEAHREYWIGFAHWRRAINGFNLKPFPDDLKSDLDQCIAHSKAALAIDADFEDALGSAYSCYGSEVFLAPEDKHAEVVASGTDFFKRCAQKKADTKNPRTLWVLSAYETYQGNVAVATATLMRGLELARLETASASPQKDSTAPSWGGPELLMSLAYLNTLPANRRPEVARGFAEAALLLAPDWHYVRDSMIPMIEALPKNADDGVAKKP